MSLLNIQIFQHVPFEGPAAIEPYFLTMGHRVEITKLFQGDSARIKPDTDALVVMGGPMSTSDEHRYAWLRSEKKAIENAVEQDIPVLGICLGAQLLAEVLGSETKPMGYREIGWFPVEATQEFLSHPLGKSFPKRFTPLHWHGDTFGIPGSSVPLGFSEACANQGFVYKEKQIGLQFHLEFDQSSVRRLAKNAGHELDATKFVCSEEEMLEGTNYFIQADRLLAKFLGNFVELCK